MKRKTYHRIVSLAPSITETLSAMGFVNRLAGRTEFCDWPDDVASIPVIGGFNSVELPAVMRLAPDMVIGTSLHAKLLKTLENEGIATVALPAHPVYAAPAAISAIGRAVGAMAESDIIAKKTGEDIERIRRKAHSLQQRRVCYLCNIACPAWYDCQIASSVEFLNCSLAGRKPPALRSNNDIIATIIADAPAVVVIPECHKCSREENGLSNGDNDRLKAYFNHHKPRIVYLASKLLARPGPRAAEALEQLGRSIFNHEWSLNTI